MLVLTTIIIYFLLLFLISKITSKASNSNTTFFKADNQAPWFIVAIGMIGASISGVTFVSVPGMPMQIDMTYMQLVFGFFLGYLIVAHLLLPLYYKLGLTSIYSYLHQRIGRRAYQTGSLFFLLSRMLGTAAKLYLVCLILQHFVFRDLTIPLWLIAAGAVSLVWIYTHKSGIKTIVWTDALQTTCLVLALLAIIYSVLTQLDLNFSQAWNLIQTHPNSRIFVFDDWVSKQNFFKQFLSGVFIVIVMTGLDQDMMQKNLSCKNLRAAQKNMYTYGFAFIPLNFLFLSLGILLLVLNTKLGLELPTQSDDLLPMLATEGYLGQGVTILFTIGIIAAAFSNSDSALAAMTTSVCVDLLNTEQDTAQVAIQKRHRVHLALSLCLIFCISFVDLMKSQTVIDAIYTIASYTYGPLLGMFAFGLFTNRQTRDKLVPYIALAAPLFCYFLDRYTQQQFNYKLGYELLMLNGLLTFTGLYILSKSNKNSKKPIKHAYNKC